MSEPRRLWIPGPAGRLEAVVRLHGTSRAAAVITHPHPLYGGTLHNPVVFHADRELFRRGLATLRFNFRGAGNSEGTHDAGEGEVDDLAAAVSWLRGLAPGVPMLLVGYSFGAVCALRHARNDPEVAALIAIGLPCRTYPCDEIEHLGRPLAVVQAGEDEFGSPREIRDLMRRAHPRGMLYVVQGSSHLFPGRAEEAAALVVQAAETILDARTG